MKKLSIIFVLALILSLLPFVANLPPPTIENTLCPSETVYLGNNTYQTKIYSAPGDPWFYSSASDGDFPASSTTSYNDVWTNTTWEPDPITYMAIGQQHGLSSWTIYRGFIMFDTSTIPPGATIQSGSLNLYGKADLYLVHFNITIQNGQPTYPHDPAVAGDYDKSHYSGDGGTFNISDFTTSGYNTINLNADGISWINKGATTKLFLRSSNDIAGVEPPSAVAEYVSVYCSEEAGTSKDPYLAVTYTEAPPLGCYSYRQTLNLSRPSGAVTNYTMKLTVYNTTGTTSGSTLYLQNHAKSWTGTVPNDLRFTKSDGTTELDYWIETSNSTQATVWVEFDSIGTGPTFFYAYYGLAGDTTTSNGDNTFIFFDDFSGTYPGTKWTGDTDLGSVSGGILTCAGNGAWRAIRSATGLSSSEGAVRASGYVTPAFDCLWGLRGVANGSHRAEWFSSSIASPYKFLRSMDGTSYSDVATNYTTGAYETWDILVRGGTNSRGLENGGELLNSPKTSYPPNSSDMSIIIATYTNNPTVYKFDWILLRQYAYTEPTFGTWSSEETIMLAAPTNFSATDGTYTDKVVLTWTKATGATGYSIYYWSAGWVNLVVLGDVGTYNDTSAPAPTITPGATVASDGVSTSYVGLALSGTSANNGASRNYLVVSVGTCRNSTAGNPENTGYRSVGTLTYQWMKSAADSDAAYSDIGGATASTYNDTAAPPPTITAGTASASDNTSTAHVTLSISGESANAGAGRYYKCALVAAGAVSQNSTANRGYRKADPLGYQWYRSAADSDADYSLLGGATTDPYNDTGAPAPTITAGTATASDGSSTVFVNLTISAQSTSVGDGRYYYCHLTSTDASPTDTNTNRGYRAVGALSYQWQRSAADSDADYSNIAEAIGTSYNDTGAPAGTITPGATVAGDGASTVYVSLSLAGTSTADGVGRYYHCVLNADGAATNTTPADRGYRTIGPLVYQWQRSLIDSDANYGNIWGATASTYNDTAAPSPTVTPGTCNASDGTNAAYVVLNLSGESANDGDGRYYQCVMNAEGATEQTSSSNRGYRGASSLHYQWWRSAADSDAAYLTISGGFVIPYNDTGAPSSGDGRYYICTVSMTDATSQNATSDRGYRALPTSPTVGSSNATDIGATYAIVYGNITDTGGEDAFERGFDWGYSTGNYTYTWNESGTWGTGEFSHIVFGLTPLTSVFWRVYAANSNGTGYSGELNFTTLNVTAGVPPTVISVNVSSISWYTATLEGDITDIGTDNADVRGFEWGTSSGNYTDTWAETGDFGADNFSGPATGLSLITTYFWRAFAANSGGINYSAELNFTTLNATLPLEPTNFTVTITDKGGVNITGAINLTWTMGINATTTLIRVGTTGYPQNVSDGNLAYYGNGTNVEIDGLSLDTTTYYYSAWSENPFGYSVGHAEANTGGVGMAILILGILPLGFLGMFLWKRLALLAYASAATWGLFGFFALQTSTSPSPTQIQDIYMGLFWVCVALVITMALLPLAMREKKEPEELYVDELDQPLEGKQEKKEPTGRRRSKPSQFAQNGKM